MDAEQHSSDGADEAGTRMIARGRAVLEREAAAVQRAADGLGEGFAAASAALLDCGGRVVCIGVGKSGIVGRKLAASLASLGTPAFFVHAAEAVHGDLGMLTGDDVVILLSHSGSTAEVVALLPHLRALGARTIALTDNPDSPLGRAVDVVLCPNVTEEADHLGLAPTASTTAALALGDALAVAVAQERGFAREDFHRRHPGGALGRALAQPGTDRGTTGEGAPPRSTS